MGSTHSHRVSAAVRPGAGGGEIYLLSPDAGAKPGHRVH